MKGVLKKGKYLLETVTRVVIYDPYRTQGIKCYIDADFSGGWGIDNRQYAENILSRSGYIISYDSCPVLWARKLQTEIVLIMAESEYIALSMELREVIQFMYLS